MPKSQHTLLPDFSPSGKTMLDVLEKAGLCENVTKLEGDNLSFTVDPKTGIKITGMLGKKGGLEKSDYETLNKGLLEQEQGFKIFMFHTALEEFKPESMKNMEAQSAATLPKNFNYYAGGHVHYIFDTMHHGGLLTFPGALFPNNFKEIEEFKHGGFYIVDEQLNFSYVPVKLKDVESWKFSADDKTPEQLSLEIEERIKGTDTKDKIVTMRVAGTLSTGKPSDIKFKELFLRLDDAYFVMKNTSKLKAKVFEELKIEEGSVEEIEQKLLKEHSAQATLTEETAVENQEKLTEQLMQVLDKEKAEGEKNADFEKRIVSEAAKVLNLRL